LQANGLKLTLTNTKLGKPSPLTPKPGDQQTSPQRRQRAKEETGALTVVQTRIKKFPPHLLGGEGEEEERETQ